MKKDLIDGAVLSKKHRDKTGECAIRNENFCERHKNWFQYWGSISTLLSGISQRKRAIGTSKNAIDVNDYIDETNIKLFKLFQEMQSEGVVATAQELHKLISFTIGVHGLWNVW